MDDKLERILEHGIASYATGEPLAGLPERILGRIGATERAGRRRTGWSVAFGVGVAGMALLLMMPHERADVRVAPAVAVWSDAGLAVPVAEMPRIKQPIHRGTKSAQGGLPKLAVFPTPTTLTAEERGLMALMKRDPEGTAAAFESLRKNSEPLQIPELEVQPLEQ